MFYSLSRTVLTYSLAFLFRIACLKEYLLPSTYIKKVCGNEYHTVSLEARTIYWLLSCRNFFKDFSSITDEQEKFKKMRQEYTKVEFTPQKLDKIAKTLQWLFLPEEVPFERITLDSCNKPGYFAEFNSNTSDSLCFLYFHGGAYLTGFYANGFPLLSSTCKELKANLMVMTYDFLPDTTLEQIIEQTAKEAYDYLVKEKKVNPKKIVLIGESAGGNLVLNLGKLVGKNGCACVVAASPWIDLSLSFEQQMLQVEDCILTSEFVEISKVLVARDTRAAYYSPIFWTKEEVEQLPPLFLSVSQSEKFIIETNRFKEILNETSTVQYQIVDQFVCLPHGYALMLGMIPEAKQTTDQMLQFIKTCIAKGQQ